MTTTCEGITVVTVDVLVTVDSDVEKKVALAGMIVVPARIVL